MKQFSPISSRKSVGEKSKFELPMYGFPLPPIMVEEGTQTARKLISCAAKNNYKIHWRRIILPQLIFIINWGRTNSKY